jgi:hypothetical protein
MTINVQKSACIPLPGTPPLTCAGASLPTTTVYKYLGFPHGTYGINWHEHLRSMTEKASRHLAAVEAHSHHWTPASRLTIYKTFIRPQAEYGMAVIYHAIPLSSRRIGPTSPWQPITDLHNRAVSWITGVPHRHSAASALLALPPPYDRAFLLAIKYRRHILGFHPESPAATILRLASPPLPGPLLHTCRADLTDLLPPPHTSRPTSLPARARQWQLARLAAGGIMARKILPRCRPPRRAQSWTVTPDPVIHIRHECTRESAIRWRLGTFGYNRPCPVCLNRFFPSHILHPGGHLLPTPPQRLIRDIYNDISADPAWRTIPYSILDCALNSGAWDYFNLFLEKFYAHFPDFLATYSPLPRS